MLIQMLGSIPFSFCTIHSSWTHNAWKLPKRGDLPNLWRKSKDLHQTSDLRRIFRLSEVVRALASVTITNNKFQQICITVHLISCSFQHMYKTVHLISYIIGQKNLSYRKTLELTKFNSFYDRRQKICLKFIKKIMDSETSLLTKIKKCYNTRDKSKVVNEYQCRTNSFFSIVLYHF